MSKKKSRFITVVGMTVVLCCFVTLFCGKRNVVSPHAHNELLSPYNTVGARHEIGGAFAYNSWSIDKIQDVTYTKTYPTASMSAYYHMSYGWPRVAIMCGLEGIGANLRFTDPDFSGFVFYLKPHAGLQLDAFVITLRLTYTPLLLSAETGNDKWVEDRDLKDFIRYNYTLLIHNPQPAAHTVWAGVRAASRGGGYILGYEHVFNERVSLRAVFSDLEPGLFAISEDEEQLERVGGTVYYLTVGVFRRL